VATAGEPDQSRRLALLERQLEQARADVDARNDALDRLSTEQTEQIAEWQKAYDEVITRHAAEINDLRATMKQEIDAAREGRGESDDPPTDDGRGLQTKVAALEAQHAQDQERIHQLEEQATRTRIPGDQSDLEAELAALRGEVQAVNEQLERERALLKRARALLGKQLEEGVDDE
jgi:hypothetical protein